MDLWGISLCQKLEGWLAVHHVVPSSGLIVPTYCWEHVPYIPLLTENWTKIIPSYIAHELITQTKNCWLIIFAPKKNWRKRQRFRFLIRPRQDTDFTMKDAFFFFCGPTFLNRNTGTKEVNLTIFFWRLDIYINSRKTKKKVKKKSRKNKVETVFTSFACCFVVLAVWLQNSKFHSQDLPDVPWFCLSKKIQMELKRSHRKGFQEKEHQPKHMCRTGGCHCVSFFFFFWGGGYETRKPRMDVLIL